ncbi:hypothetical protein XELAEV_18030775mg [Xenopus laevis]|uniref:Uncharacterized protein n=1 Tax=Xenopus laevis TaxID=8355 RepID=A0A974CLF5_XENLA|nr:hypothetical protein XELAEV_18030775mg [Xenopus laevis]
MWPHIPPFNRLKLKQEAFPFFGNMGIGQKECRFQASNVRDWRSNLPQGVLGQANSAFMGGRIAQNYLIHYLYCSFQFYILVELQLPACKLEVLPYTLLHKAYCYTYTICYTVT